MIWQILKVIQQKLKGKPCKVTRLLLMINVSMNSFHPYLIWVPAGAYPHNQNCSKIWVGRASHVWFSVFIYWPGKSVDHSFKKALDSPSKHNENLASYPMDHCYFGVWLKTNITRLIILGTINLKYWVIQFILDFSFSHFLLLHLVSFYVLYKNLNSICTLHLYTKTGPQCNTYFVHNIIHEWGIVALWMFY